MLTKVCAYYLFLCLATVRHLRTLAHAHLNIIITVNCKGEGGRKTSFFIDPCTEICGKYFSYPWANKKKYVEKHINVRTRCTSLYALQQ